MANSGPVCQRKSTRYLKVPLKSTEQIYLVFLIPTLISCIVYIVNFSADLVVAIQHFKENNLISGCCTIGFMYAPAVTYFVLTVSRPDWWMTDDDKVTKGIFCWFCLQVCQLISFVLFALYRYAGLIVLSFDAVFLSGEERTKTLNVAAAPAAIELYFFLQAWFQAMPQAVFQTHLFFKESNVERTHQSVAVQVLSIIMSIVVLAIQTTSFQRFESQRVGGRKLPWAMWLKKYCVQELSDLEERTPLQSINTGEDNSVAANDTLKENEDKENVETKAEEKEQTDICASLDRQISVTPPLPPKNVRITPPPTPLRGITTVAPLAIPDAPAPPRPDSICNTADDVVPEKVPTVIKRKYSSKGLEEDDPVGKFLAFLWWFFFILARVLTIVVFHHFYPLYLYLIVGIHYAVMLAYLFYYAKYYDVITFFVNLWLGIVYIFCLIEYRIKFKYADKWLLPYYVFVIVQNISMIIFWYLNVDWDGFWYTYIFYVVLISMALCISSTLVYHVLLKPKKCRVYSS